MPRRPHLTVVAILLVVLLTPSALAADRPVSTETDSITATRIVVPAPAVAELADGTLAGLTTTLEITVRNGTGNVFMDTRPLAQLDMQGSARLAAATAAAIAGRRFDVYDYFITMRADAPIIGGPSAGGTMAVAFTALLAGWPMRDDVLMTGMINPDGTIGPVGGILEKSQAAYEAGATLFLVPEGQSIVTRAVQRVAEDGRTIETRQEQVDVRTHARERWGLTVREVVDVQAAIENFTGVRILREAPRHDLEYPLFEEVMGRASGDQLADAHEERDEAAAALDDADLDAQGRTQTRRSLEDVLRQVEEKLARADTAYGDRSYYTASSLVFQSRVDLRKVALVLDALEADAEYDYLVTYLDDVRTQLAQDREGAAAVSPRTITGLEALGAAQVRAMEAGTLLDRAEALLDSGALGDAIDRLAFAEERRRSVVWWLDLAEELDRRSTGPELDQDPSGLARDTVVAALQAVAYAEVLLEQTGTSDVTSRLLDEAKVSMEESLAARESGLHVGSIYLALEAQVQAHAALSLVGVESLIATRVERSRDRAIIEIERARTAGVEPVLAVSYVDFAGSLVSSSPPDALVLFGFAATIARTSLTLTDVGPCGIGGSCRPDVILPGARDGESWTDGEAVAFVALAGGFVAGAVVVWMVTLRPGPERRRHAPVPVVPLRPVAPPAPPLRRRRSASPQGTRPVGRAGRSAYLSVARPPAVTTRPGTRP